MNIVVIGHGMVGHKFLEQLHALGVADANVTVLCEEPRAAYDRVHLSEFFSGKSAEDLIKDLYKAWNDPGGEKPVAGPVQQPPYTGATRPDQLVIAEGRILALADAGPNIGVSPDKYVRLHSLETGMPLPLKFRTGKGDEQVDRNLTTYNNSWDVALRVVGSHLYVVGSRAVVSYNLDRPAVAGPILFNHHKPVGRLLFRAETRQTNHQHS